MRLAIEINRLITARRLTRITAARRLAVSQQKISALKHYKLHECSVMKLMTFLLALGQDVEICIRPRRAARGFGKHVQAA